MLRWRSSCTRTRSASAKPWFPWRGSETGHDGKGPGWDPNGSHRWHTEEFAAEAAAAAKAVTAGGGAASKAAKAAPKPPSKPAPPRAADGPSVGGVYTVSESDSDGVIAFVGRCLGVTEAPWAIRSAAAEAVCEYNGVDLDHVWKPGDVVRLPPAVDGVRTYTVQSGDGMIAITKGLGLGRSAAAQKRAAAINAWQGETPHPGVTWYGGAA